MTVLHATLQLKHEFSNGPECKECSYNKYEYYMGYLDYSNCRLNKDFGERCPDSGCLPNCPFQLALERESEVKWRLFVYDLAYIAKHNPVAVPLALQLFGYEPCPVCGFIKKSCRCKKGK